jgi:hypothetical protein
VGELVLRPAGLTITLSRTERAAPTGAALFLGKLRCQGKNVFCEEINLHKIIAFQALGFQTAGNNQTSD